MDYQAEIVYFMLCSDVWLVCGPKQRRADVRIQREVDMQYTMQTEEVNFIYIPELGVCRAVSFT